MEGGVAPYSSAMAPSGSYILIIVSQPVTENDKESILDRLNKGLLSWDVESTGCDLNGLESVCSNISSKHLDDTDVLIQHSTESLGVEVLVNPTVSTLKQCVKNLLSTSTGHKHLIHAGYTFAGSGSWILQNGTFSFDDFLEIFQQADVQNQKRCNINIHCSDVGLWSVSSFTKDIFTNVANLAFNPPAKVPSVPGSEHLINCLRNVLNSQDLEEMMEASSLVGNIRFNRPTLYMFPAGQGDCALFGINGFNMLIDGGFNRKPCSWEFIRHLDRLDAVLVTRLCENNVCGMSTLMKRKYLNNTYPQIGYVFCNIPENKNPSPKEADKDSLIVSVVNEGHNFIQTLNELKLKPHQCWRDLAAEPFVLYHKVGHGTLEMHVLSPPKDSKEMKDFISEWSSFKETFSSTKSGLKGKALDSAIPLSHATSICAVLIWRPADPKDTITRILFPGSAPQNKIFESLERLKTLDVLSHPVVTKASLSAAATKTITHKVEKSVSRTTIPNRKNTASPALSVTSVASRNGDVGHKPDVKKVIKEVKKEVKKDIRKDVVPKERKEAKNDMAVKKDTVKKEAGLKEVKKEIKKIVKKDVKELKATTEKKSEIKNIIKKETNAASKTVTDIKKTSSTTIRKSPAAATVKKDVKLTTKTTEVRKSAPSKLTDTKNAKEISNKKVSEAKTATKSKPKSANSTPKAAPPKTKPVAVPKPGSKMTKAVAASSIVASAVAVTAAAFELNEKKDEIVMDEAEVSDSKEPEIGGDSKELEVHDKHEEEMVVSPLPPEALSPTPSESVSLTPSDTLSSAPLETVSPTPPLANDAISTEEKEVNEMKDIEQDMPYEAEMADEIAENDVIQPLEKESNDAKDIEAVLEKYQQNNDVMSTSFVGFKDEDVLETGTTAPIEVEVAKFESESTEKFDNSALKTIEKEEGYIIESQDINVDDQLAQMSMEGSFCARGQYDETETSAEDHEEMEAIIDAQEKMETNVEAHVVETNMEVHEEIDKISDAHEKVETNIEARDAETNIEDRDAETNIEARDAETYIEIHENMEAITDAHEKLETGIGAHEQAEINSEVKEFQNSIDIHQEEANSEVLEEIESIIEAGHLDSKSYESTSESHNLSQHKFKDDKYSEQEFISEIKQQADDYETGSTEGHSSVLENIDEKTSKEVADFNFTSHETFEKELDYETETKSEDNKEILETEFDSKDLTEVQEKLVVSDNIHMLESSGLSKTDDQPFDYEYDQQQEIQALKETISRATNEDYEISRNIINDVDMQETSVDEPEEIVRKESAVSITLNDEEVEDNYLNQLRRKSGTESEDDVDLKQYMLNKEKDSIDHDKLGARLDQDSDDEDVVKSPTPHAIVDYEGHMDDLICGKQDSHITAPQSAEDKDIYITEKQDFDEKDHDSTEDRDIDDDGEMIRHPTPPGMKYSEEEMRDPIGQHYITTPGMKLQGTDITEQPLYEEGEDETSDRSESPVVEQPVFSSVVEPDFPELVTVSGGTTPSEPQSPKAGFDTKKFTSETGIMEALSEHDLSESSTHSPLCQDGTATFDLPVANEPLQTVKQSEEDIGIKDLDSNLDQNIAHNAIEQPLDKVSMDTSQLSTLPISDAPSDDESYSQNEKSETRSEKSDDDDEKSNPRHDNSDMHDDKSDNQFDGKSDVMDDERRSDIHEDDRTDSHHEDKHDHYEDKRSDEHLECDREHDKADNFTYEGSYDDEMQKSDVSYQHSEFNSEFQQEIKNVEDKFDNVMNSNFSGSNTNIKDELEFHKEYDSRVEENVRNSDFSTAELSDATDHFDATHVPEDFTFQKDESKFVLPHHDEQSPSIPDPYISSLNTECGANTYEDYKGMPENDLKSGFESSHIETTVKEGEYEHEDNFSRIKEHDDLEDITDSRVSLSKEYETGKEEFMNVSSAYQDDCLRSEGNVNESCEQQEFLTTKSEDFSGSALPHSSDELSTLQNVDSSDIHHYETTGLLGSNSTTDVDSKNSLDIHNEYEIPPQTEKSQFEDDTNFNYVAQDIKSYTATESYETTASTFEQSSSQISSSQNVDHAEFSSEFSDPLANKFLDEVSDYSGNAESSKLDLNDRTSYDTRETDYYTSTSKTEFSGEVDNSKISHDISGINSSHPISAEGESVLSSVNGKDQTSFSHTSEYNEQYSFQTHSSQLQETGYSVSQQESSYIINSRFHSDSPEDNVMRSDSSPDVPYPPGTMDPLSGGTNPDAVESHGDNFSNLNVAKVSDVAPLSPNSQLRNANRDDPYGESSDDDEDSSSVPGTVSPYAYTNKAYAKEEEDIDGNHIYKDSAYEKNSEILHQVEFDGNNPQSVTTQQVTTYSQSYQEREFTGNTNYDFQLEEWEKPMGLPTPPESTKTLPKKTDRPASKVLGKSSVDTNGKVHSPTVASKMSSPLKKPKPKTTKESSSSPVYVDLAYVPHHGDPHYCDVEYFKKIRARYYVFSGINPSKEVLNALLEAKKTWKEDLEVTIIPTYETDTLGYWMAQNQDDLATYSIEVAPSASRCTVNLQDHETSCAAYRLEF